MHCTATPEPESYRVRAWFLIGLTLPHLIMHGQVSYTKRLIEKKSIGSSMPV